jgi:hypothetical protein
VGRGLTVVPRPSDGPAVAGTLDPCTHDLGLQTILVYPPRFDVSTRMASSLRRTGDVKCLPTQHITES